MASLYPSTVLKVEPHTIPTVRKGIAGFLEKLSPLLDRLGRDGYIQEPWLGDIESYRMTNFYNTVVMGAPDGPYQALRKFEQQLIRMVEELQRAEDNYRRTEGANVELWGRKA